MNGAALLGRTGALVLGGTLSLGVGGALLVREDVPPRQPAGGGRLETPSGGAPRRAGIEYEDDGLESRIAILLHGASTARAPAPAPEVDTLVTERGPAPRTSALVARTTPRPSGLRAPPVPAKPPLAVAPPSAKKLATQPVSVAPVKEKAPDPDSVLPPSAGP